MGWPCTNHSPGRDWLITADDSNWKTSVIFPIRMESSFTERWCLESCLEGKTLRRQLAEIYSHYNNFPNDQLIDSVAPESQYLEPLGAPLERSLNGQRGSLICEKVVGRKVNTVQPFSCVLCGRNYLTNERLMLHIKKHLDGKLSVSINEKTGCHICRKNFATIKSLNQHRAKFHEVQKEKAYRCTLCREICLGIQNIREHYKDHEIPYFCSQCGNSFTCLSLKTGLVDPTGNPKCSVCANENATKDVKNSPFLCDICGKWFDKLVQLKKHIVLHSDDKRYQCETCGKAFASRRQLNSHLVSHSEKRPFCCALCDQHFKQRYLLKRHLALHNRDLQVKCQTCGAGFQSCRNMKRHAAQKHGLHYEQQQVKCQTCGAGFQSRGSMKRHAAQKHGTESSIFSADEQHHICDICGRRFHRKEYLQKHVLMHTNHRSFQCDNCGKFLKTKRTLTLHKRRHRKEHPHKCSDCSKGFFTPDELRVHFAQHHGPRLRLCSVCGKGYSSTSNLNSHMRVHDKKRKKKKVPTATLR